MFVKTAYISALRSEGHAVERVVDIATLGATATDSEIRSYAQAEGAVILTNDTKDFVAFDTHSGIIIVPQTAVTAGAVAGAINRIERVVTDPADLVLYATNWL
jgi:predicted nuclease of predicted toxin-antitoxin system